MAFVVSIYDASWALTFEGRYFSTALPVTAHSKMADQAIMEKPAGMHANAINLTCFRLKIRARPTGRNQTISTSAPNRANCNAETS